MTKTKPDCVNYEAWLRYMETRKTKKYPITPGAILLLVNRLLRFMQEGQDITRMLDQSTVAGWNTVYPVKGYVRHEEKPVQARQKKVHSPEIVELLEKIYKEGRRIAKSKSWHKPENRAIMANLKRKLELAENDARKMGDLL